MFWSKMTRLEKELDDQKKVVSGVKDNYLARFEEVNSNIHTVKDAIIEEVHKIQLQCAVHTFTPKP